MKTMTCRQLGGACDLAFHANTFEEMAELSKLHGRDMYEMEDNPHLEAMKKMREMMEKPEQMQEWYSQKRKEFEDLEDNR